MLAHEPKTDTHLFRLLTIAVVLGSKFLDDNTFINRSWSEVSGIQVHELNELELEWLLAIKFKLHRDPAEQHNLLYDEADAAPGSSPSEPTRPSALADHILDDGVGPAEASDHIDDLDADGEPDSE